MEERLTELLDTPTGDLERDLHDPEQAGMDFFCLCAGDQQIQAELGVFKPFSDEQLRARVAHAVRVFLYGYRP